MKTYHYFLEIFKKIQIYIISDELSVLQDFINEIDIYKNMKLYQYNNFYDFLFFEISDYLSPVNTQFKISKQEILNTLNKHIEYFQKEITLGKYYVLPAPAKHSLYFDDFTQHDPSINDYEYFTIIKGLEFMSSDELTDMYIAITGTHITPDPESPHRDMVLKCLSDIPLEILLERFPVDNIK